jgi:hypothetical protein
MLHTLSLPLSSSATGNAETEIYNLWENDSMLIGDFQLMLQGNLILPSSRSANKNQMLGELVAPYREINVYLINLMFC